MIYQFNVDNSIIHVNIPNDTIAAYVQITIPGQKGTHSVVPCEDERGKYFIWKKQKVYFDDWIRMPLESFLKRVESDASSVRSNHLCYAILTEGIDRIVFEAPFYTVTGDLFIDTTSRKMVKCKIKESYCHEVKDNYKLNLVPLEKDNSICDKRSYYVVDLLQDIKEKKVKIMLCE